MCRFCWNSSICRITPKYKLKIFFDLNAFPFSICKISNLENFGFDCTTFRTAFKASSRTAGGTKTWFFLFKLSQIPDNISHKRKRQASKNVSNYLSQNVLWALHNIFQLELHIKINFLCKFSLKLKRKRDTHRYFNIINIWTLQVLLK